MYIRQTTSELTGEHSCVMVRGLNSSAENELEWMTEFAKGVSDHSYLKYMLFKKEFLTDFRRRFLSLLSYKFREFGSVMALSILEAANNGLKPVDKAAKRGPPLSFTSCSSTYVYTRTWEH